MPIETIPVGYSASVLSGIGGDPNSDILRPRVRSRGPLDLSTPGVIPSAPGGEVTNDFGASTAPAAPAPAPSPAPASPPPTPATTSTAAPAGADTSSDPFGRNAWLTFWRQRAGESAATPAASAAPNGAAAPVYGTPENPGTTRADGSRLLSAQEIAYLSGRNPNVAPGQNPKALAPGGLLVYKDGGMIRETVRGFNMRTGEPVMIGENGPEQVIPNKAPMMAKPMMHGQVINGVRHYAIGGTVTDPIIGMGDSGTMYLVGDSGAETIVPSDGGSPTGPYQPGYPGTGDVAPAPISPAPGDNTLVASAPTDTTTTEATAQPLMDTTTQPIGDTTTPPPPTSTTTTEEPVAPPPDQPSLPAPVVDVGIWGNTPPAMMAPVARRGAYGYSAVRRARLARRF